MCAQTKAKHGFSLIEVLIAIAVLAVGLIAVISIFPFSIKTNKGAEQQSLASSYARTKLEQVLASSYDEVNTGTIEARARVTANPNDTAYPLERQTVVTFIDSNLNTSVSDVGLKKVVVTVYWPNRQGGDNTLVLTSILSNK